jgi:hypothetical protein
MCAGVPTYSFNEERKQRLAKLIKIGASLISYRLGYQDRENYIRDIEDIRTWWESSQSAYSFKVTTV